MADLLFVRRAVRRTEFFGPSYSGLSLIGVTVNVRNTHDSVYFAIDATKDTGLRVLDLDANSADELVRRMTSDPESLVRGQFIVLRSRWGGVVPWTMRTVHRLRVESVARPNDVTPPAKDLQDRTRESLARHLEWTGWREDAAMLRAGDGDTTTIIWTGVAHDATLLLAIVALGWSLGWLWPLFDRRTRALRRGRCPKCGYDLAGVRPRGEAGRVKQCPECGSWWEWDFTGPK